MLERILLARDVDAPKIAVLSFTFGRKKSYPQIHQAEHVLGRHWDGKGKRGNSPHLARDSGNPPTANSGSRWQALNDMLTLLLRLRPRLKLWVSVFPKMVDPFGLAFQGEPKLLSNPAIFRKSWYPCFETNPHGMFLWWTCAFPSNPVTRTQTAFERTSSSLPPVVVVFFPGQVWHTLKGNQPL